MERLPRSSVKSRNHRDVGVIDERHRPQRQIGEALVGAIQRPQRRRTPGGHAAF